MTSAELADTGAFRAWTATEEVWVPGTRIEWADLEPSQEHVALRGYGHVCAVFDHRSESYVGWTVVEP